MLGLTVSGFPVKESGSRRLTVANSKVDTCGKRLRIYVSLMLSFLAYFPSHNYSGSWTILWIIMMRLNLLKEMHEILMGERWCVTSSAVEIVNPIISAKSPVKSDHCPVNYWIISSKGSLKCQMNSVRDSVEGTTLIFMELATGLATGCGLLNDISCFYFWYHIKCLDWKLCLPPPHCS